MTFVLKRYFHNFNLSIFRFSPLGYKFHGKNKSGRFLFFKRRYTKNNQENVFVPFPVVWSADGPVPVDGVPP